MELKKALRDDWNTPRYIVDLVLRLWPQIDLDPCSNDTSIVDALCTHGARDDGLGRDWEVKPCPRIFINPPYDCETLDFVSFKSDLARRTIRAEVLLLVPVKSDQAWFQRALTHATAVCFIRGRVKFGTAGVGAAFSSCLFYWGSEAQRFREVFTALGAVLNLGGDT